MAKQPVNEEKLKQTGKKLQNMDLPPEVDLAIERGIQKGKSRKRKQKMMISSLAAAAVLFLAVISSIRLSPAFASAVSGVPGFDTLVEIVSNDDNLTTALEHEYIEPVEASAFAHSIYVDVEGVVIDGSRMIVFYALVDRGTGADVLSVNELEVAGGQGEEFYSQLSYWGEYEFDDDGVARDKLEINYDSGTDLPDSLSISFDFSKGERGTSEEKRLSNDGSEFPWELEVALPLEKFEEKRQHFNVNEAISIENQSVLVEEVVIHPTQTELLLSFDEDNTFDMFKFEDMILTDGQGNEWSQSDISTVQQTQDGRYVVHYDSSFFADEPEELYLEGSVVSAVEQERNKIAVDPEKEEVVSNHDKITIDHLSVDDRSLTMDLRSRQENYYNPEVHHSLLSSQIKNSSEERLETISPYSMAASESEEDGVSYFEQHYEITFADELPDEIIYLPLSYYPHYLQEPFRIQIR